MCLFPTINLSYRPKPYQRTPLLTYECGHCPECLRARASRAMVRDYFEASEHADNCMVTLTYDSYVYDKAGRVVGERVSDLKVCKADCQKFVKRLRSYIFYHYGVRIKYRLSAEYGKKTHRAHYHVLIFGFCFPDCVFYKKSKRGNVIYKSAILQKLWKHGICTVDCKRITPANSRYCSKYTMKDRGADDTFSLCSQHIGVAGMLKAFNGLSYIIEGREYPIPRVVWEHVIVEAAPEALRPLITPKYVNYSESSYLDGSYQRSVDARRLYRSVRDDDPRYQRYLDYWQSKGESLVRNRPSAYQRILALPDDKYFFYKQKALEVFQRRLKNIPATPPGASRFSRYERWCMERGILEPDGSLPFPSRHGTASDRKSFIEQQQLRAIYFATPGERAYFEEIFAFNPIQLNFFDFFDD